MERRMVTDEIWKKLRTVMETHGCYDTKNSRVVMEGILGLPALGKTFLTSFFRGRPRTINSIDC